VKSALRMDMSGQERATKGFILQAIGPGGERRWWVKRAARDCTTGRGRWSRTRLARLGVAGRGYASAI